MNKRTLGVAAVFLVGCAVGGASSQLAVPKASAQQAATLTKWEYLCVDPVAPVSGGWEATLAAMNKAGAESWELVSGGSEFCFKRPKL